jgi:hypothetical protein
MTGEKLDMKGCSMEVYRDDNYELADIKRPSVQKLLRDAPFYVKIDTVIAKDVHVEYDEIAKDSKLPSRMFLDDMEITVTGTDNDTTHMTDKSVVRSLNTGTFMKAGKLKMEYIFPMQSEKEHFYCSGTISAMSGKSFNPLTKDAMGLEIKNGQMQKLEFNFEAKEDASNGKLKLWYQGLELELKKMENGKPADEQKLKSLLFNKVIVRRDNPDKNGFFLEADIHAEHEPRRYFLFYTLSSVGSGIPPAIMGKTKAELVKKIM